MGTIITMILTGIAMFLMGISKLIAWIILIIPKTIIYLIKRGNED
jgi:predicted benzoate:H+ symporter BenE